MTPVAFLHTSPAAIAPLAAYFADRAPHWQITNLLDDAILRFFRNNDEASAEHALLRMAHLASERDACRAGMVTCSSVSAEVIARLNQQSPIPLLKIDVPMAQAAVSQFSQIGVLITFPPTLGPTMRLLQASAAASGRTVSCSHHICDGAYDALLAGDKPTHDRLLHAGARRLRADGAECIVLAQVSMASCRQPLEAELEVPVFSSLETSYAALTDLLGE